MSQNVRQQSYDNNVYDRYSSIIIIHTYQFPIPAKFNSTVPGTLSDCSSKQTTTTTTSNPTLIYYSYVVGTATNSTMLNEKQSSKFEVGSQLFNIVVGVGGGMVMLLVCSLCCVCVVFICRQQGTKGEYQNQHSMHIIV